MCARAISIVKKTIASMTCKCVEVYFPVDVNKNAVLTNYCLVIFYCLAAMTITSAHRVLCGPGVW